MATFRPILIAVSLIIFVAVSSAAPKQKQFNLEIPDECKGKRICNVKPKGYDEMQEYVESLLNSTFVTQTMTDRYGEDYGSSPSSDEDNCPYNITMEVSPYIIKESDDSVAQFIIQNKVLSQPIKMIKCAYNKINVNSSEQCFTKLGLSAFNMKSSCVESSAYRSLLVYDPKADKIKKTPFSFPCCCTCKVEKKFDFSLLV